MKEEANNEMDLMLQRWGSNKNQSVGHSENGGAGSTAEVHLDADELNAYAESTLPPAARTRYTEHLADCTRCRQLVSSLSQAAGLVFKEETSPEPAISGLGKFISSFFSPMVLRYAIPALGLILVAALGLSVFRQQQPESRSASVKEVRDTVAQKTEPPAPATLSPENAQSGLIDNQGRTTKSADVVSKAGEEQAGAKKDSASEETDAPKVEREEKREGPVSTTDSIAAPVVNSEPPKLKAAINDKKTAPAEGVDDNRRGQAVATGAAPTSISVEQQKELAKARDNEESGRRISEFSSAESKSKNEVSRARSQPTVGAGVAAADRADKDEAETRSIVGHQFRRRGSVWVDVTYDSRATVNVARGSDQFRALVADEPSIKTIADQLDGEIIVMWNNRAYRIR